MGNDEVGNDEVGNDEEGNDEETPDSGSGSATIRPDHDAILLDAMLGRLASYLRMCGYDTVYALDRGIEDDDALRRLAAADARRLVTRDRDLAAATPGAIRIDALDVGDQLRELRAAGVVLRLGDRPSRCGSCNGPVERIGDADARPAHAPDEGSVWRCRDCGQHFWKGSHWDDVADTLASLSRGEE